MVYGFVNVAMHGEFVSSNSSALITLHIVPRYYVPMNSHYDRSNAMTSVNFIKPSYTTSSATVFRSANMFTPPCNIVACTTQSVSPPQYISSSDKQVHVTFDQPTSESHVECEAFIDECCRRATEYLRQILTKEIFKALEKSGMAEQNSSDNVQNSDCIYISSNIGSIGILGPYPLPVTGQHNRRQE